MASEGKGEDLPAKVAEAAAALFEDEEALRYAVAVDGSEMAHKAFTECTKLMNKKDYINVLHVSDSSKGARSCKQIGTEGVHLTIDGHCRILAV